MLSRLESTILESSRHFKTLLSTQQYCSTARATAAAQAVLAPRDRAPIELSFSSVQLILLTVFSAPSSPLVTGRAADASVCSPTKQDAAGARGEAMANLKDASVCVAMGIAHILKPLLDFPDGVRPRAQPRPRSRRRFAHHLAPALIPHMHHPHWPRRRPCWRPPVRQGGSLAFPESWCQPFLLCLPWPSSP